MNQPPANLLPTPLGRNRYKQLIADISTSWLRKLPAEISHNIGMRILRMPHLVDFIFPREALNYAFDFRTDLPGIGRLKHPIGLAAGFDKNAIAVPGISRLGFSFIEVGTVTPVAQPGNPKPRLFRFPEQMSLVNRMGFNNWGAQSMASRLAKLNWQHASAPLGINLGKNKSTAPDAAVDDYLSGFEALRKFGKYMVVNISSPNTAGLRDLADPAFLDLLADRLGQAKDKVWIKLDPDLEKRPFQQLIQTMCHRKFAGVILTITHKVTYPQTGGLSGHPLATLANTKLEWAYEVHKGSLPMIASGGILSGLDIIERVARGASAVQIYTAFIYRGPFVVTKLLDEVYAELHQRGVHSLNEIRNTHFQ